MPPEYKVEISAADRQSPGAKAVPAAALKERALSQAADGCRDITEGLLKRPARLIRIFPPSTPPAAARELFRPTFKAILHMALFNSTSLRMPLEVRLSTPSPTIGIAAEASLG